MKKTSIQSPSFHELAVLGKNNFWRYVLSFAAILAVWIFGSLVIYILYVTYIAIKKVIQFGDIDVANFNFDALASQFPYLTTFMVVFSIIVLIPGVWIALRYIHRRSIGTAISVAKKIRWSRLVYGLLATVVVYGMITGITFLDPKASQVIQWNSVDISRWLLLAPLLVVCILLQSFAEELVFRGYVFQSLAHGAAVIQKKLNITTKNAKNITIGISTVASVVLFWLAHAANSAFQEGLWAALTYFVIGFILMLFTLKEQGIEVSTGIHAANNIIAFLFLGSVSDNSYISLFVDTTPASSLGPSALVFLLLTYTLVYFVLYHVFPKIAVLTKKRPLYTK